MCWYPLGPYHLKQGRKHLRVNARPQLCGSSRQSVASQNARHSEARSAVRSTDGLYRIYAVGLSKPSDYYGECTCVRYPQPPPNSRSIPYMHTYIHIHITWRKGGQRARWRAWDEALTIIYIGRRAVHVCLAAAGGLAVSSGTRRCGAAYITTLRGSRFEFEFEFGRGRGRGAEAEAEVRVLRRSRRRSLLRVPALLRVCTCGRACLPACVALPAGVCVRCVL